MIWGLDYLGGSKYGDVIVREHPQGWAAGFFANTFGPAWGVIEKLLATGRCPRVRVHGVWDDAHLYRPKDHDPVILKELRRANALKAAFPHVHVQYSPFCEHTIKGQALASLLDRCGDASRDVEVVNSVYKGDFSKRFMNEVHGPSKPPKGFGAYQYSADGSSSVDTDVETSKALHREAQVYYFWVPQFNLRKNANDPTPRPQRKAVPTGPLIDSVIYLSRGRGDVKVGNQHLWKSHADQHSVPVPEPRALKPVFITPVKAKRVELVADNGQVVAVTSGPQPFADGRLRYYLGEFGFVVSEKARRVQGHPVVKLRADGKVIGSVNPAYRAGSFRD
jgi:hypothetical protein